MERATRLRADVPVAVATIPSRSEPRGRRIAPTRCSYCPDTSSSASRAKIAGASSLASRRRLAQRSLSSSDRKSRARWWPVSAQASPVQAHSDTEATRASGRCECGSRRSRSCWLALPVRGCRRQPSPGSGGPCTTRCRGPCDLAHRRFFVVTAAATFTFSPVVTLARASSCALISVNDRRSHSTSAHAYRRLRTTRSAAPARAGVLHAARRPVLDQPRQHSARRAAALVRDALHKDPPTAHRARG